MKFNHTAHLAFTLAFVGVIDDDAGQTVQMQAAKGSIPVRVYIPARLYCWLRGLPWRAREYLADWRRDLGIMGEALVTGGAYWRVLAG